MDKKELNSSLRQNAIENGLCAQWQEEWKYDWDLQRMVSQFYRGIDFFIKKRFISKDFFKAHFDKVFLRENGVLVDDKYSLVNPANAILVGKSESTIRINGTTASTIYALDDSKIKVEAKNSSFVIVHAFGNTKVEANKKDNATVVVITHSHEASISAGEGVKVKEEYDYLTKK